MTSIHTDSAQMVGQIQNVIALFCLFWNSKQQLKSAKKKKKLLCAGNATLVSEPSWRKADESFLRLAGTKLSSVVTTEPNFEIVNVVLKENMSANFSNTLKSLISIPKNGGSVLNSHYTSYRALKLLVLIFSLRWLGWKWVAAWKSWDNFLKRYRSVLEKSLNW